MGASAVVVFTEGTPLGALERKRALTGAESRLTRRPAAPPILKSDIVSFWMRGMVVANEDSLQVWFGCELQAGHDTPRIGFSRAWQAEHPQGSVCSSFLLHQLSLVHLRREST